jgi:predicted RNA-binding Zn-ribbon protein involved in translation (DUF1610 family)
VAAGDGRTRFVAVGAPKADDAAVSREACPACGDLTGRGTRRSGGEVVLTCEACGTERARFEPGPDED